MPVAVGIAAGFALSTLGFFVWAAIRHRDLRFPAWYLQALRHGLVAAEICATIAMAISSYHPLKIAAFCALTTLGTCSAFLLCRRFCNRQNRTQKQWDTYRKRLGMDWRDLRDVALILAGLASVFILL